MNIFLIFLQIGMGIVALFKDELFKNVLFKKICVILLLLFILATGGIQLILQKKEDFKNKYDGTLTTFKTKETKPILALCDSKLVWYGDNNTPIISLKDDDISLSMVNGKVNITTNIRDNEGDIIGKIENNEWRIYSPQRILDRNFNKNSLEIKNGKGDIVFQVQLDGNEVKLAGDFYSKEEGKNLSLRPWIHECQHRKDSLFLYPSTKYPHDLSPIIN